MGTVWYGAVFVAYVQVLIVVLTRISRTCWFVVYFAAGRRLGPPGHSPGGVMSLSWSALGKLSRRSRKAAMGCRRP